MRCIAANRSILTVLDQNATLSNNNRNNNNNNNQTAMTDDIECMDIIQFADGWYSYPDLNTFNTDFLLDTLTIRVHISIFLTVFFLNYLSFALAYQTIKSSITVEC